MMVAAIASGAGATGAQTLTIKPVALSAQKIAIAPLPLRLSNTPAPTLVGMPKTEIDGALGHSGFSGAAGFLCGRLPGPDNNGAATALGYDPQGRFVGAKLSFAFK